MKPPADISRLLQLLVDLDQEQGGPGFPASHLAENLELERERVQQLLVELQDAGWIRLTTKGHSRLATPTLSGYEQAAAWRTRAGGSGLAKKIPRSAKLIGGSLVAALLALLWWWIGLSPATSPLQPFWARIPLKVYVSRTIRQGSGYWFHFPEAPDPSERIVFDGEKQHSDFLEPFLEDGASLVFDGRYSLSIDLENIDTRFQANIERVQIRLATEPVAAIEDTLFVQEGMGGGGIWSYEVDASTYRGMVADDGSQIYEAELITEDEVIDYIYLKPGERESVKIEITLPKPGLFTLTPLIHYAFRDGSNVLEAESHTVLYPARFRVWYDSFGQPVTTNQIIVDTQSWAVDLPSQTRPGPDCLNGSRWVAFVSDMLLPHAHMEHHYLIDMRGDHLMLVAPTDEAYASLLSGQHAWTRDGSLLVGSNGNALFRVNPGSRQIQELATPFASMDLADFPVREVCFSNGRGCLDSRPFDDTNQDGQVSRDDNWQLALDRGGLVTRWGVDSASHQHSAALSPDENWLAYVQGTDPTCNIGAPEQVFIMDMNEQTTRQLTQKPGCYGQPVWSPDGRRLALFASWPDAEADSRGNGLYALEVGTGLMEFIRDDVPASQVRWSPDGEWLIAAGERLTLIRVDGSCSFDLLTLPEGYVFDPAMAP